MSNIEQVVMESYKKVQSESGITNALETLDIPINRESGLDSLGLVNLLIEIEEELDLTLESVLIEIRQSQTLQDIAVLVRRAVEASKV